MGDQWTSDSMIAYIEKNISVSLDNENVMQIFQNMKSLRGIL